DVYRMMYGATCFGILFSTIGTILGGLWADDSWGRFWGWDPKENGALLIVIWNALMLHARWGKMCGGYGFSMLAMGGSIVTAWSFFGTNELGIGVHSYGFTEGALLALGTFIGVHLVAIALAWAFAPVNDSSGPSAPTDASDSINDSTHATNAI
ncbi:MAG: cytochrome c biogenesis protein CcsA, partial [Planctomycetota bacterium]